jgi:hypothetical protein
MAKCYFRVWVLSQGRNQYIPAHSLSPQPGDEIFRPSEFEELPYLRLTFTKNIFQQQFTAPVNQDRG